MNTIVETIEFTRKVSALWSLEEYEDFKAFIAVYPDAGKVVPGTGGVRKMRWRGKGAGKRSGTRVIYFNTARSETWLLALYAKNERETIPAHELKKMREAIHG